MGFSVATDRVDVGQKPVQGAMFVNWIQAAGWNTIPITFVVDGGRIAWIGTPGSLDEVLERVVNDTWDLNGFKAEYSGVLGLERLLRPLRQAMDHAYEQGQHQRAVELCDEILALDPIGSADLAGFKFQELYTEIKDVEQALAFARSAIDGVAKNDAAALGQIAYVIVNMSDDGVAVDLDLAKRAAVRANELAKGTRPWVCNTLAQIYFMQGDIPKAIAVQKQAVAAARNDSMREQMTNTLNDYISRSDRK